MTNPPPQYPNLPNPNPNPNPDLNPTGPPSWQTFTSLLLNSRRILCLSGAGLSAPSGLATWRGSSGHWNNIALKELASPKKFAEDPVIVWKFYGERILEALSARPNAGHWALGEMARMWGMGEGEGQRGWLTVNQNVDGLLEQTTHPTTTLKSLHGTLRTIHCTACPYTLNVTKPEDIPFLLTLHNPNTNMNTTSQDQPQTQETPAPALTTAPTPTPQPPSLSTLPHCPSCSSLLRPSIVWFGERLAAGAPDSIDEFVDAEPIDLVISAGTSCEVYPAAEWVETARADGAVLAVVDIARDHKFADDLYEGDWFCQGDIAVILPKILGLLQGR